MNPPEVQSARPEVRTAVGSNRVGNASASSVSAVTDGARFDCDVRRDLTRCWRERANARVLCGDNIISVTGKKNGGG